tara:strand:+ start:2083 stop:3165 length:1083 start_codon:yes stop_codon:yes gene_type:complete
MIYLSIGSNLGDRLKFLQLAVGLISYRVSKVINISGIYETPAMGFKGNPFYNICVEINSDLGPKSLLQKILDIEKYLGRVRSSDRKLKAREIDIDIVYYNNLILKDKELHIPHKNMHERNFVLYPLLEISSTFKDPRNGKFIQTLLNSSKDSVIPKKIEEKVNIPKIKKVIAVEGLIGIGKTEFSKKLSDALFGELILEEFNEVDLEKFYKNPTKNAFETEKSFFEHRIKKHNEYKTRKKYPQIFDYLAHKSIIFSKKTMTKFEFDKFQRDFNQYSDVFINPEIVIFLDQETNYILHKIKRRGRTFEKKIDLKYLNLIKSEYNNWKTKTKFKIFNINLNKSDFKNDHSVFLTFLNLFFKH